MKKILLIVFLLTIQLSQAQTVQQVRDLINSNLATGSKITAEKHREVENAIVSLIEDKKEFLLKGSYSVGNVAGSGGEQRTITFSTVGTSNYLVVGSLVSNGSNWDQDNDVMWMVREKGATSFKLLLREVTSVDQNLIFNYALIPY